MIGTDYAVMVCAYSILNGLDWRSIMEEPAWAASKGQPPDPVLRLEMASRSLGESVPRRGLGNVSGEMPVEGGRRRAQTWSPCRIPAGAGAIEVAAAGRPWEHWLRISRRFSCLRIRVSGTVAGRHNGCFQTADPR